MITIEKQEMFKEALSKGINIFAGAGFSKLPDPDGRYLPAADELCSEICSEFSVPSSVGSDLEKISNIATLKERDRFQNYLRNKYTVEKYNPLYDIINQVSLNCFITTNIDNIIQCVMDKSKRYSLHDIHAYGAAKKGKSVVTYIPLHGNVKDLTSHLYFGKSELASVDSDNRALFSAMESKLYEAPTLFWGYGFHDNAIERVIVTMLEKRPRDIWIQCMPGNENIEYFRALGCFVIEGTTEELLRWIQSEVPVHSTNAIQRDLSSLENYYIPSRNKLVTVSRRDYFTNGQTAWYCIISNYAYETRMVNTLYEQSLKNKNVIGIGIPFSGKTTIMMQLAAKSQEDVILILNELTIEEAKRVVNVLGGIRCLVFIDQCCEDIYVTKVLMEQDNIRVVGFTNDYTYESAKHLLDGIAYDKVFIDELVLDDAQRLYQYIPETIRKERFRYKANENEKYSMLEFLGKNIQGVLSHDKVKEVLNRIKNASIEAFQVVALATYLSNNCSALSTDILFSFFELNNYEQVKALINLTKGYLSAQNILLENDSADQDFYCLRSSLFSKYASEILQEDYRTDYASVIEKFIINVSPYKIYRYYIFKRSAFDARFFKKLFGDKAHKLYEYLTRYDTTAYSLQQWALYKAYLGDYIGAFADIDQAIAQNPHNFSIRNSRAIILFEANKGKDNDAAYEGLKEAMDTLQQCYYSDKRKVYHAQKYAEYALYLWKQQYDNEYLAQAKKWLMQLIYSGDSTSKRTKGLLKSVENEIKKMEDC